MIGKIETSPVGKLKVDRDKLDRLLLEAKARGPLTPAELREQRISWAYGNSKLSNDRITRKMVEQEHDRIYGRPSEEDMNMSVRTRILTAIKRRPLWRKLASLLKQKSD